MDLFLGQADRTKRQGYISEIRTGLLFRSPGLPQQLCRLVRHGSPERRKRVPNRGPVGTGSGAGTHSVLIAHRLKIPRRGYLWTGKSAKNFNWYRQRPAGASANFELASAMTNTSTTPAWSTRIELSFGVSEVLSTEGPLDSGLRGNCAESRAHALPRRHVHRKELPQRPSC
jgi:hypothetical protein